MCVCRDFSFNFIAFDFPTEFSALFDSCGVIINLNNEIPKMESNLQFSHLLKNRMDKPKKNMSLRNCYLLFGTMLMPCTNTTPKWMFWLIFCYQKLSLWNMHETIFFRQSLPPYTKPLTGFSECVCVSVSVSEPAILLDTLSLRNRKLIWILWLGLFCV